MAPDLAHLPGARAWSAVPISHRPSPAGGECVRQFYADKKKLQFAERLNRSVDGSPSTLWWKGGTACTPSARC